MISKRGTSKNETLEIIRALIEFSSSQNTPIESTIDEFMPYIVNSSNFGINQFHDFDKRIIKIESSFIGIQESFHKNSNPDQLHSIDVRLSILENTVKGLEDKLQLQAQRAFWINIAVLTGILGGIAGIVTLVLKLTGNV